MTKTIHVRVSDEVHRILKEQAEIEAISMADLIRRELECAPLNPAEMITRMRLREHSAGDMPESVRLIREGRGDW